MVSGIVEIEKNSQNLFPNIQDQSLSHCYPVNNFGVFNFDGCFLGLRNPFGFFRRGYLPFIDAGVKYLPMEAVISKECDSLFKLDRFWHILISQLVKLIKNRLTICPRKKRLLQAEKKPEK